MIVKDRHILLNNIILNTTVCREGTLKVKTTWRIQRLKEYKAHVSKNFEQL